HLVSPPPSLFLPPPTTPPRYVEIIAEPKPICPAPRYNAPMPKTIHDPHDSFFRETFSRLDIAEDFLREYLPPAVAAGIDWASLKIAKDSFVEKALRKHFSDLVYSARHGDRAIKIYLLLEHKSSPDHWVSLQLLRYQLRMWELHRKQQPGQPLPPVIPLVLYHGQTRWRTPTEFHALFGELDAALSPYVPNFRHALCDLNLPEPEQIRGNVLSRLTLLALKHIFDAEPKRALADILPLAGEILDRETSLEMLEVVLRYYVQTTQTLDEHDIHELIIEASRGEDYMPTFIDRYIELGEQRGWQKGQQDGWQKGEQEGWQRGQREGWQKGQQEGWQKGEQKGQRNMLLRQMAGKFGTLTAQQRHRVEQADSKTLLRWSEQVLFAATADEALR
ncbi:MAG: Rpn family recombination-promoting nuclease/putative transposase, partial [Candidatus Methylumidiphilus sp.]